VDTDEQRRRGHERDWHRLEPAAGEERERPSRQEIFGAAVELASAGSATFKRFARRYSLCAADADDAYQRSLEILLTKAPTTDRGELRAWLHTVIKHEALALRRQRERALADTDSDLQLQHRAEPAPALDEQASGRERIRQTAEALAHLKAAEIECLLLKALGYSYNEIADRTGYSWTKVNRSLTEGRRRLIERFGEIASGARCSEFEALLSAACDGESTHMEDRHLRAHLSRCGSCRAALREYRTAPSRLAELLPPGALLPLLQQGNWWSRLGDWVSAAGGERAGVLTWKLQQGVEALGAQKATVVVASTTALAGGAAVHEGHVHHPAHHRARSASAVEQPVPKVDTPARSPEPVAGNAPRDPAAPEPSAAEARPVDASRASPAGEFIPEGAAPQAPPAQAPAAAPKSEPRPQRATASGAPTGQEFGP
jgi:RNA polymerase sigma factor (sigma-70 family)